MHIKNHSRTKRLIFILSSFIISLASMSLIIRHDVSDQQYIALADKYPQVCHLSDGEATLIKENWMLTAAHVATFLFEQLENEETPQVSIGDRKLDVNKVIIHPNYKLTRTSIENDIALIQIKEKVTNIPLAKLYDKEEEKGKEITIVGRGDFGTGLSGPVKRDKITRAATNRIDKVYNQWLVFSFDNPESENVTELEGISGPGDSGGPAFIDIDNNRYIVGVSSNQRNNGKSGVYGVIEYYARVSFYRKWIENEIK